MARDILLLKHPCINNKTFKGKQETRNILNNVQFNRGNQWITEEITRRSRFEPLLIPWIFSRLPAPVPAPVPVPVSVPVAVSLSMRLPFCLVLWLCVIPDVALIRFAFSVLSWSCHFQNLDLANSLRCYFFALVYICLSFLQLNSSSHLLLVSIYKKVNCFCLDHLWCLACTNCQSKV